MYSIKLIGSQLYQWEIGRKISISLPRNNSINSVEFSQDGYDETLLVKPYEEGGDLVADIPNVLLQTGKYIRVYLSYVDENVRETFGGRTLVVTNRPKPSDYIYTETEVLSYSYLDQRLTELEGDGLSQAVEDYLKENPIGKGATEEEAAQIAQNKADIETLNKDKLSANELPAAINDALAEAKASGEFDGKDGVSATHSWNGTILTVASASGTSSADLKGEKGDSIKGDDGISPTVAVSKNGKVTTISITDKNGTKVATINDGTDGKTPVKNVDYFDGKNGTSVTVKNVSESNADGGSNVVTFSDGKTVTIKNGSKGNPGATPKKGTDYFTEADKTEMVNAVIAALPIYNGEVESV